MVTSAQYTITPFTLVNDDQLIEAQVAATPLDDLRKHEVFVGIVTSVTTNKWGKFAYFKTPDLVGGKFIRIERILGYAHLPTPTPMMALADEFPNVAIDVLMEQVATEVPAPIAAQPAHMTDTGRYVGTLEHLNVKAGYGYVAFEGDTTRFETRHVFGGAQAVIALMGLPKDAPVSFALRTGIGVAPAAIDIVVPEHEKSESHYTWAATRKAAAPAKPLPRPRRNRDMNAQTVRAPQA